MALSARGHGCFMRQATDVYIECSFESKTIKDHKRMIIFMISKVITKVQNSIYHMEYKISLVGMMPE